MTTPEIDGSPSTVEGVDKPRANSVTTPVYDPTRPDCASCGEAWEDHLGRPFFHCPEQESNYVPLPSPAPVDAAPPKDPDEIEALVDVFASATRDAARSHTVENQSAKVNARAAVLSAVASLRARAEASASYAKAWKRLARRLLRRGREYRDGMEANAQEAENAIDRADEAESSLKRMRERVADSLRSIIANDATRYQHHQARRSDGKTPREAGSGTIFLTPREIATAALRSLENESAAGVKP